MMNELLMAAFASPTCWMESTRLAVAGREMEQVTTVVTLDL